MQSNKINLKIYLENPDAVPLPDYVPVFHSWIQQQSLPGHLLIDVADYAHVPAGPGMMLISHQANLGIDEMDDRRGLLYVRKAPAGESFPERLTTVFRAALTAAQLLEQEPAFAGKLKFKTDQLTLQINDRLLAPNNPETYTAIKGDLETFLTRLYPNIPLVIQQQLEDPRNLFHVAIKSTQQPTLAALLQQLT